ncbi:hypothetical protein ACFE04_009428 [Oxalis oulophora]
MYSSGDFDGSSAFAGGGFMPTQSVQPPDSSGYSPAKNRESRSLLPLTIKQINNDLLSTNDGFSIDGVDINNITLLGRVCHKDERNITEVVFLVDDGTGQIECTKWVQERIDSNEVDQILVGMYVRVHGHLKGILNKRTLNAYSIRPVTDFNEITTHFIECVYVHVYNTKIRGGSTSAFRPQMTNPNMGTPSKGYQANTSNQFHGQNRDDGVKRLDERIKEFLEQPAFLDDNGEYSNGVHRDVIARQLNVPADQIMEPLTFLVNEGDIYTTSDDFHFKSARNG